MRGPDWDSTAIFLAWDDWGGFYDSVTPPTADANGYGLRVASLVISPYARRGYVDHQVLSFDAYNKFIEDDFLGGARLNPVTDGGPTRARTYGRACRSSATWRRTSTSPSRPGSRCCWRPTRPGRHPRSDDGLPSVMARQGPAVLAGTQKVPRKGLRSGTFGSAGRVRAAMEWSRKQTKDPLPRQAGRTGTGRSEGT